MADLWASTELSIVPQRTINAKISLLTPAINAKMAIRAAHAAAFPATIKPLISPKRLKLLHSPVEWLAESRLSIVGQHQDFPFALVMASKRVFLVKNKPVRVC